MTAGGWNQILTKLDSSPYETAGAVKRLTCGHAVVAFHAQVEIHHQQRVVLNHAVLATILQYRGKLRRKLFLGLEASFDGRAHLPFSCRKLLDECGYLFAANPDHLALARRQNTRIANPASAQQRHLAEVFAGTSIGEHALRAIFALAHDLDVAVTNDVQTVAGFALFNQNDSALVVVLDLAIRQQAIDELTLHALEQLEFGHHHPNRALAKSLRENRARLIIGLDKFETMPGQVEDFRSILCGDDIQGARQSTERAHLAVE